MQLMKFGPDIRDKSVSWHSTLCNSQFLLTCRFPSGAKFCSLTLYNSSHFYDFATTFILTTFFFISRYYNGSSYRYPSWKYHRQWRGREDKYSGATHIPRECHKLQAWQVSSSIRWVCISICHCHSVWWGILVCLSIRKVFRKKLYLAIVRFGGSEVTALELINQCGHVSSDILAGALTKEPLCRPPLDLWAKLSTHFLEVGMMLRITQILCWLASRWFVWKTTPSIV